MEEHKCCQCGSTEKLFQLESGAYACKKCLDGVGDEFREIKNYVLDYMHENFQIIYPEQQIKILQSIIIWLQLKNNLASPELSEGTIKILERMNEAFKEE